MSLLCSTIIFLIVFLFVRRRNTNFFFDIFNLGHVDRQNTMIEIGAHLIHVGITTYRRIYTYKIPYKQNKKRDVELWTSRKSTIQTNIVFTEEKEEEEEDNINMRRYRTLAYEVFGTFAPETVIFRKYDI